MLKRLILFSFALFVFAFVFTANVDAVYVNGYFRGGSYVQPYYRSAPNCLRYDNYSYRYGQPLYNNSYYSCCRSSNWYTPSYTWQPDYYYGYNNYLNNHYDW